MRKHKKDIDQFIFKCIIDKFFGNILSAIVPLDKVEKA